MNLLSIDHQITQYLLAQISDKKYQDLASPHLILHYTQPYIINLTTENDQKIIKNCKYYCKNTNIKVAFLPFKVEDLFSFK